MSLRGSGLALLLAVGTAAGAAPKLTITTEYSPPTSMVEDGRVVGTATDRVREIMARVGVDYTIDSYPWKRAYAAALSHAHTCVYSTTRTPEREHLFKWVGPTDQGEWVLMGRADRQYNLHTLDDARHLRIGTYWGDARDEYLRSRGFLVDQAHTDVINPQKLLLGRIDLWAASLRGIAVLKQKGLADSIVPVLIFNKVKVYLACNPSVPDELITRMNAAMDAMQRDGTTRRIDKQYETWVEQKSLTR
ncbi:ABC transporter substrate-binding protein [Massilia arenosa]|uniref:ABC transporter substrate-binding protein n=1 Tax=Zemynaea arenosa TaxID=2561931 RepID=A0A4Y9SKX4_9BURK|nr:ABC transporter substrate-binding protein [Massilia arenosa]TFW23720.1 ABC transporter substrate-binding protein [Massilia arenosa]